MSLYPKELGLGFTGDAGRDGRLTDLTPTATPVAGLDGRPGRSVPGVPGNDGLAANPFDGKQNGLPGLAGNGGNVGLAGKAGTQVAMWTERGILTSTTTIDPIVDVVVKKTGRYTYSGVLIGDQLNGYTANVNGTPFATSSFTGNFNSLLPSMPQNTMYMRPASSGAPVSGSLIFNLNVDATTTSWNVTTHTAVAAGAGCYLVTIGGIVNYNGSPYPFTYAIPVPSIAPIAFSTTTANSVTFTVSGWPRGATINLQAITRQIPPPEKFITFTQVPSTVGIATFDRPAFSYVIFPTFTDVWFLDSGAFGALRVPMVATPTTAASLSADGLTLTFPGAANGFSYTTAVNTFELAVPSPKNYQHKIAGFQLFNAGDVISFTYTTANTQTTNDTVYHNFQMNYVSQP